MKLSRVLGEEVSAGANTVKQDTQLGESTPPPEIKSAEPVTAEQMSSQEEDDDTMSYFARLAKEG